MKDLIAPVLVRRRNFVARPSYHLSMGARRAAGHALLVLAVALVARLDAQSWAGIGRASGTVVDARREPLAGAVVTLRFGTSEGGPPPITTNAKGHWSALGLAAGNWRIQVEKPGFVAADGRVTVVEAGPGNQVTIELRPLSEIPIGGTEGNPQTGLYGLDRGNALLAQGRTSDARREYELALAALPEKERPAVLRAIARTHFLEHDFVAALVALRRAAGLAPDDRETAQLLAALAAQASPEQVKQAALQAATDSEAGATDGEMPTLAELGFPKVEATPRRAGAYSTTLGERSRLSAREALFARTGLDLAAAEKSDPEHGRYDLSRYSFAIYAPAECATGASPCGVLVWASPTEFGGMRLERWRDLLAKHRLIWVGANGCGNGGPRWIRYGLALDAIESLKRLYPIDASRVYAAGYSGGGRIASVLAVTYPEVFAGGFYLFGCDYFRKLPVPYKPGAVWPAVYPKPRRATLERARDASRFVFLTGELDFNRVQTRDTERAYREDGFSKTTYLEIPAIGHYGPIPPDVLARALALLDPAR